MNQKSEEKNIKRGYGSPEIQRVLFTILYVFFCLKICKQISQVRDFSFPSSPATLARMESVYRLSEYSVEFQYVLKREYS